MPTASYSHETLADPLNLTMQSSRIYHCVRSCIATTHDKNHALNLIINTVTAANRPLYHFTVTWRRRYNPNQIKWDVVGGDSPDVTALLRHSAELNSGGVVVLEDCVPFLCDQGGNLTTRMALWQILSSENKNGLTLVFMEPPESESRLPQMLADQFVRLSVPYPRARELEIIAREEIAHALHMAGIQLDTGQIKREAERLSTGVVGLSCSAARDAFRDALAPDPQDFDAAYHRLQACKSERLNRELAMNVLDSSDGEEPIGLDYLVEYLEIRKDRMRLTGPGRAKGIILIGPPGTGKTMLARMIGKIVHLPVVEFRISSLMNSLLGETERRFTQAFATLEAMAPNVVFIDEIEKAFGDSSERDGGTMMRCTGSLLSWLSDNPHPNYIVATSNSLRRMGDIGLTLTRSERFDAAFYVDVPSMESRRKMLERWIGDAAMAQEIAEMTERFSGADVRSVVKHAQARAEYAGEKLSVDILKAEVERKRLRAIAVYDEFQELREWGRMYCDPAGPTDS